MRTVRIADLKAHLSKHLRAVQEGATVTVLDRNTPIARMVPIERPDALVVRAATRDWASLDLPDPLPSSDIVSTLREERGDR